MTAKLTNSLYKTDALYKPNSFENKDDLKLFIQKITSVVTEEIEVEKEGGFCDILDKKLPCSVLSQSQHLSSLSFVP